MKTTSLARLLPVLPLAALLPACGPRESVAPPAAAAPAATAGQSAVADTESRQDIVKVAAASAAHSTLVRAVQAAGLVDALANTGPFTVFAPTNEAFGRLPAGTVEGLLRPAAREQLRDLLQYHVAVAVYRPEMLRDGQVLNMANGDNVRLTVRDGRITLNGSARVVATVPAANGIIHVVDAVLQPPVAK